MNSRKWFVGGALALAAMLGAAQAQARADVQWSISVGTPVFGAVVQTPVYAAPVYSAPVYAAPVYAAPVYGAYGGYRAPVYRGHGYRDGYHERTRWDADGDGIPNRYDRVYNPRWDRDGDGIPNRHDRRWGPGRY